MKKYDNMILFGGGGLLIGAGLILLISGSGWGAIALVAGVGLMAFGYARLMRCRGYDPDQGTINGLAGHGKQQSEAVKMEVPGSGEQPANIWDIMTENKE